ncbi:Carnitine O-palmitoyltransferase 1, liver [Lamellibrachia satsuma]|nr:Carnitine O-palmitoyltransferase 1, liver [Lamellibrachia satsuma]
MAEGIADVSNLRVFAFDEGKNAPKDFLRAWRKALLRRFFRTRNLIRNGMWPTSIWNLMVCVTLFSILLVGDWEWAKPVTSRLWNIGKVCCMHEGVPLPVRVFLISTIGGVLFFIILMYKRRWLLRVLLSYNGWMYEMPRSHSTRTYVWGSLVRLLSGYHPTLYSCQKSLPYLPLPRLNDTVDKFLTSLQALYGKESDEFQEFETEAKKFKSGVGVKLQRALVLKSWWAQNWITDWWEKYVYHMCRAPLSINSNYYIVDHSHWQPTHRQVSRAASVTYQVLCCKRLIEREQLPPLFIRNTIPLCMAQYERMFGTTRIPGEEVDELVQATSSKHVVVQRHGIYYQLDVFDVDGLPLSAQSWEKQMQWIVDDADRHKDEYSKGERSLAAFTAQDRTEWSRVRQQYFQSGLNKDSLDILESALFHVVLDNKCFKTWSERGKYMLHGNGATQWFDKSFNLLIFSDGRYGLNAEHSWADAPVMGHVNEFNLTNEVLKDLFDADGYCRPIPDITQAGIRQPIRLVWDMSSDLEIKVDRALTISQQNNDDLDFCLQEFSAFGKGFIKKCKVSPDAYIQLALQLAYYRDAGRFVLTYEASMTRLFLHGRTETVRSLTQESCNFVQSMSDENATNEERIRLLQVACERHQSLYRDAMTGKGMDRHLFGLYVVSKGLGLECDFLKRALAIPWVLSTSQQPQQQIATSPSCDDPQYKCHICPGGGFGPVSSEGYGVSYMIPGNQLIFFHVTSKKSCAATDSQVFMQRIFRSLWDIRKLFEPDLHTNDMDAVINGTIDVNPILTHMTNGTA